MRIERTTEQALDEMMELIPYITPILDDVELKDFRDKLRPKDGKKADFTTSDLINGIFPLLITKHRSHLYALLGHLKGVSADEARTMPVSEIKEALSGGTIADFFDFFSFFLQMALRV